MFRRPAFRTHLQVEIVSGNRIVVRDGVHTRVLDGRLLPLLVPWIDGDHSVNQISDLLRGRATPIDVHFGLTLLAEQDLLVERTAGFPLDLEPFRDLYGIEGKSAEHRLATTSVRVSTVGDLEPASLLESLEAFQVNIQEDSELEIVWTDDALSPELAAIDKEASRSGRSWLPVAFTGSELWIGPLFHPEGRPCWSCLAARLRSCSPDLTHLPRRRPTPAESSPALLEVCGRLAAIQVLRWVLAGCHPELEGQLLTMKPATLQTRRHAVVALPHCGRCGQNEEAAGPYPLRREEPASIVERDGGYRTRSAEETLRRHEHLVSQLTGIVKRLERRDLGSSGAMYLADHAFGSDDRRLCAGKGLSETQARASALCEALERHSGFFRGSEPRRHGRLEDLGEAAIRPEVHLQISSAQYRDRQRWRDLGSRYTWIPDPFDERRETDWTPLWSLTHQRLRYLPSVLCYYHAPVDPKHDFGRADSNGTAAGNTLEEAVLQGLLELVERDAVAQWWYSKALRPGVDASSFGKPALERLVEGHRELGRRVHILDLTNDLNLPTFAAISLGATTPLLGFGTHLDASIAVARALTEMNQFLPGLLEGSPRRLYLGELEDDRFLRPARGELQQGRKYPEPELETISAALDRCLQAVSERGLEVLVLDQTRSDVHLPVVRVVVPGLRHHWARLAPGRLYDIPVELGWIDGPLCEDLLNPCHLVI